MSVVIRLRRAGSKKRPFYHMVVADSRMRRDGRFIEKVGYYNPIPRPEEISYDEERITAWIAKGAKPSTTVGRLIRRSQRGDVGPSVKERKRVRTKSEAAVKAAAAAEEKAKAEAAEKAEKAAAAAEEKAKAEADKAEAAKAEAAKAEADKAEADKAEAAAPAESESTPAADAESSGEPASETKPATEES